MFFYSISFFRLLRIALPSLIVLMFLQTYLHAQENVGSIPTSSILEKVEELANTPEANIDLEKEIFELLKITNRDLLGKDIDIQIYQSQISELAQELAVYLEGESDPYKRINRMNEFLFKEKKFSADFGKINPNAPLLTSVLDGNPGMCDTLSLLYRLVGLRLGMPLESIFLTNHTFVRYVSNGFGINIEATDASKSYNDDWYVEQFKLSGSKTDFFSVPGAKATIFAYLINLGAHYRTHGRLDDSIAIHRKVVDLYPNIFLAHINLGWGYLGKKMFDEAIKEYEVALTLFPNESLAWRMLGAASVQKNMKTDAIAYLEKALALNKDDEEAKDYLRIAKQLPDANRKGRDWGMDSYYKELGIAPKSKKIKEEVANENRPVVNQW
ncbi:MAG TPA: hypothetical protein DIW23_00600 [Anaerolineae bacterium]|nr:hypothetical protein [Anaerolineae bacterium]